MTVFLYEVIAMKIHLYQTVYNPLSLHQIDHSDLLGFKEIEISLKLAYSLERLRIALDIENLDYNYAYIPELKRFYKIKVDTLQGNMFHCDLILDRLATFEKNIVNNFCVKVDITIDNTLIIKSVKNHGKWLDNVLLTYIPSTEVLTEPSITEDDVNNIIGALQSKLISIEEYSAENYQYITDIINVI